MKKLGKLIINPEKVIKNEELLNLGGGGYYINCSSGEEYLCVCNPGIGVWVDCYSSEQEANQALWNWCEGGSGHCAPTGG